MADNRFHDPCDDDNQIKRLDILYTCREISKLKYLDSFLSLVYLKYRIHTNISSITNA